MFCWRNYYLPVALLALLLTACVNPVDLNQRGTVNVVVVDGSLTNLAERQLIRLNRSKADPLTGRFGSITLSGATVEVVVDSSQIITLNETDAGTYQAPDGFAGQVGHAYQLRFTLADGSRYISSIEVMQAVPLISRLEARFNPNSLPASERLEGIYAAAHDFYLTTQDPADQHNYYHWAWKLWERQDWCCSCFRAIYIVYDFRDPTENKLYEACYDLNADLTGFESPTFDYNCRTQCWEIIQNYATNVFDDQYVNRKPIVNRKVAQIPYYQHGGCLVEIRQGTLTADAYRYYRLAQEQTENNGGLADTPPTALVGNVKNEANSKEQVVGYFTAEAIVTQRYWLDRKDTQGIPPGLFQAQHNRDPFPEPRNIPFHTSGKNGIRPPTAVCVDSDSRTPNKPLGWRD